MYVLSLNCVEEVGIYFEGSMKTPNVMTGRRGHALKIGSCCEWWQLCIQTVHGFCKALVLQTLM
jgi:hypothetical protein